MTAVRWVVEHRPDQIGGPNWVEYSDEATAQAHAGTAAKVWALVTPAHVRAAEAAVSGLSDGGNTDVLALLAEVAQTRTRALAAEDARAAAEVRIAEHVDDLGNALRQLREHRELAARLVAQLREQQAACSQHYAVEDRLRSERDEARATVKRVRDEARAEIADLSRRFMEAVNTLTIERDEARHLVELTAEQESVNAQLLVEARAERDAYAAPACICPRFRDTGGFRVADLGCPVHGVDGTDPGDGPWDEASVDVDAGPVSAADLAGARIVTGGGIKSRNVDLPTVDDDPRTWVLPDEPGPEVTAVRDAAGNRWKRGHQPGLWCHNSDYLVHTHVDWDDLLKGSPLTDATADPLADARAAGRVQVVGIGEIREAT